MVQWQYVEMSISGQWATVSVRLVLLHYCQGEQQVETTSDVADCR